MPDPAGPLRVTDAWRSFWAPGPPRECVPRVHLQWAGSAVEPAVLSAGEETGWDPSRGGRPSARAQSRDQRLTSGQDEAQVGAGVKWRLSRTVSALLRSTYHSSEFLRVSDSWEGGQLGWPSLGHPEGGGPPPRVDRRWPTGEWGSLQAEGTCTVWGAIHRGGTSGSQAALSVVCIFRSIRMSSLGGAAPGVSDPKPALCHRHRTESSPRSYQSGLEVPTCRGTLPPSRAVVGPRPGWVLVWPQPQSGSGGCVWGRLTAGPGPAVWGSSGLGVVSLQPVAVAEVLLPQQSQGLAESVGPFPSEIYIPDTEGFISRTEQGASERGSEWPSSPLQPRR